jgi:hypothetical protein
MAARQLGVDARGFVVAGEPGQGLAGDANESGAGGGAVGRPKQQIGNGLLRRLL